MSRLSESQQQMVLRLATPLQRYQRDDYYRQVGTAVAAMPTPIGDGALYRICGDLQRRLLDHPRETDL